MIDDWRFRENGPAAPNKPNLVVFGLKVRVRDAKQSQYRAARRPASLLAIARIRQRPMAPNKANPGRGGLGIDYGLGIIDDLVPQMPGAAQRQTKPIGEPYLSTSRGLGRQTNPISRFLG
jgi:hypothetical protein